MQAAIRYTQLYTQHASDIKKICYREIKYQIISEFSLIPVTITFIIMKDCTCVIVLLLKDTICKIFRLNRPSAMLAVMHLENCFCKRLLLLL